MLRIALALALLATANLCTAQTDNVDNLKGIDGIYWRVDSSYAQDITSSERMDLNDIVELQLRRGAITLRPFILNQPNQNIPLLQIEVSTISNKGPDQIQIALKVFDHAVIERNSQRTIAKTFELKRSTKAGSGSEESDIIKSELREIMAEFVSLYKQANP
ncbi:MAG: hypothetical protein ACPGES_04965 [Coraliomargarita sp.]